MPFEIGRGAELSIAYRTKQFFPPRMAGHVIVIRRLRICTIANCALAILLVGDHVRGIFRLGAKRSMALLAFVHRWQDDSIARIDRIELMDIL